MSDKPIFSVVIVVWNQLCYTKLTVESIIKTSDLPFEFVIVDNGSRPEVKAYFDSLKDVPVVFVRNESNLGPIRGINQGLAASHGAYMVVIHNDCLILEQGWLGKMRSAMESDPRVGIVALAGRQEIYKTGCVNEATLKHNLQNEDLNAPMIEEIAEVAVVDGLCFCLRRALLEKIRGLDEEYGYMHCYDLDVSLRSREAGYRNVVARIAAMHIANGGMTRKTREYRDLVKDDYGLLKKNCRIFARKWRHVLPVRV